MVFSRYQVPTVYHYAPLHYLPFIVRAKALAPKSLLRERGFANSHFRSTSARQDTERGFGDCVFLTLDSEPRILQAKLKSGFPHIAIHIPAHFIEATDFSLCRYNIAKTRVLKRNGNPGRPASSKNGRYYDEKQVPIARTSTDKISLMDEHLPKGTMIEVLVHQELALPGAVKIVCFCNRDMELVRGILQVLGTSWEVDNKVLSSTYRDHSKYFDAVSAFVEQALTDPDWLGCGLEFDRV